MPSLTPLTSGTETLVPTSSDTQTLVAGSPTTETLLALAEARYGWEFLYPGASTYPGATTYPGLYGQEVGLSLVMGATDAQTLTPLMED